MRKLIPGTTFWIASSYIVATVILLLGCAGHSQESSPSSIPTSTKTQPQLSGDEFVVVDCLLPGQVRRLGTQVTYVTPRRPIKTTAEDCNIRGGEYVAMDRADYSTALALWLKEAEKGNSQAQYYVATMYEKGLGTSPNYQQAANWYQKALDQGFSQAAVNLGRLHEQGLGVSPNQKEAFQIYAKASGLNDNKLAMLIQDDMAAKIQTLEQKLAHREGEIGSLEKRLQEANQKLTESRRRLETQQGTLRIEHQKLVELESRYKTAQADLEVARQQPDQTTVIAQYEQDVQNLKMEVTRRQESLKLKDQEIAGLSQQIQDLEEEIKKAPPAIQTASVVDLGFEGPKIEIIDPPLLRTRGINVAKDEMSLAVKAETNKRITGRVLAPAGLHMLSANGQPVTVNDNMVFTVELPMLHPGDQGVPLEILAIDTQNKRGIYRLMVKPQTASSPKIVSPPIPDRSKFGTYYALVIGNDSYTHWAPLKNAIGDAKAIASVLKQRYGFQVNMLIDAKRHQILKALNDYRKILTEKDNLLVYYAGHGYWEKDIDRGYWIPADGEMTDNSNWILLPTIIDLLQLMSAKHVMIVADSCFSGKLTRTSLAKIRPGLSEEARMDLLKTLATKRVRTAMTSGGLKPVLDEGGTGHSVFAQAFLGVLQDNATVLEAERLFWAVRTRVLSDAKRLNFEQIPTYDPIHMAGHESLGDFIFVPQGT